MGVVEGVVALVDLLLVSLWFLRIEVVGCAGVRGRDVKSCQKQSRELTWLLWFLRLGGMAPGQTRRLLGRKKERKRSVG